MPLLKLHNRGEEQMGTVKDKCKPAVPRRVLPLIAGTMWCGVGIMLSMMACRWLSGYSGKVWMFTLSGLAFALIMRRYSFLKVAGKNLDRIALLPAKACIFSFISWRSWILVMFMITLGITLRHSPMPREYLAVIYLGIGLGLILSGLKYFRIIRVKNY